MLELNNFYKKLRFKLFVYFLMLKIFITKIINQIKNNKYINYFLE